MDKFLTNNQEALPKEITLDDIQKALDDGNAPLTSGNLSKFVESVNKSIFDAFVNYLDNNLRAVKTAKSYAEKVKSVCEQCGIDIMTLFYESKYTVDEMIYMYSSKGIMSAENKRQHYAPATALKAFEDFVIYERDD